MTSQRPRGRQPMTATIQLYRSVEMGRAAKVAVHKILEAIDALAAVPAGRPGRKLGYTGVDSFELYCDQNLHLLGQSALNLARLADRETQRAAKEYFFEYCRRRSLVRRDLALLARIEPGGHEERRVRKRLDHFLRHAHFALGDCNRFCRPAPADPASPEPAPPIDPPSSDDPPSEQVPPSPPIERADDGVSETVLSDDEIMAMMRAYKPGDPQSGADP